MSQVHFARFVATHLRWNFSVNLLDITFITLGLSLVSRETVIPVLVSQLTDSKLVIALIPAIWGLGFYLPQLLMANHTERMRYKKPFVMLVGGTGERLPYLLIALALGAFALRAPLWALVYVLVGVGTAAFSTGIATPAWYDMIAKVIPVQRRGIWSGLGHGLGALMGLAGAAFVGYALVSYPFPDSYILLFSLAFIAVAISWIGLALNREPPSKVSSRHVSLRHYLGRLPIILARDRNYARFLLSRSVVHLGTMAIGFFMVYSSERLEIDGASIGLLTGVLIGSQAIMNVVWGLVGDRFGHKVVLTGAALAIACAALVALVASSILWIALTFVLLGAYLAADSVSGLNIILEFCTVDERPTYIGLTNTLLAPMLITAPLLGGGLATWLGYPAMLIVATIVAGSGAFLIAFWVREPRRSESRHLL